MDRLERILSERKLKGIAWNELALKLPVSGEGLRIAFKRGNVAPEYLDHLEQLLGIQTNQTIENTEDAQDVKELRFEDVIADKVLEKLEPLIREFIDTFNSLRLDLYDMKNQKEKLNRMQDENKEVLKRSGETLDKSQRILEIIEKRG